MSYGTFESLDHEGYHATVAAEKREETLDRAAARVMENVGDYFRNATSRADFFERWSFAEKEVRKFIALETSTTDENVHNVCQRVAALTPTARNKTASLTWEVGSPGFDTGGNPYPTIRAKGSSGILYVIAPDDEGTYILTAIEGSTSTIFADGFPEQECKEIAEEYEQTKTAAESHAGKTSRRTSRTTQSQRVARLRAIARRKAQAARSSSRRKRTSARRKYAGLRYETIYGDYSTQEVAEYNGQKIVIDRMGPSDFSVLVDGQKVGHERTEAEAKALAEKTVGFSTARKQAWAVSDDGMTYTSNQVQDSFDCPTCGSGNKLGFSRCACGKQWNSYSINTPNGGQKMIAREVEARPEAVLANRRRQARRKRAASEWFQRGNSERIELPGGVWCEVSEMSGKPGGPYSFIYGDGESVSGRVYDIGFPTMEQAKAAALDEVGFGGITANRRRQARRKLANTTEQVNALDLESLDGMVGKDKSQYMDNQGRILNLYIEDVYAELVDSETSRIVVNFDSPEEAAQAFQGVSKTARRKQAGYALDWDDYGDEERASFTRGSTTTFYYLMKDTPGTYSLWVNESGTIGEEENIGTFNDIDQAKAAADKHSGLTLARYRTYLQARRKRSNKFTDINPADLSQGEPNITWTDQPDASGSGWHFTGVDQYGYKYQLWKNGGTWEAWTYTRGAIDLTMTFNNKADAEEWCRAQSMSKAFYNVQARRHASRADLAKERFSRRAAQRKQAGTLQWTPDPYAPTCLNAKSGQWTFSIASGTDLWVFRDQDGDMPVTAKRYPDMDSAKRAAEDIANGNVDPSQGLTARRANRAGRAKERFSRRARTAEADYPPILVELTDLIDEIGNTPGVPATASSTLRFVLNSDGEGGSAVADRIEDWMNSNDMELFPTYTIEALAEIVDRLRGQEGNYLTARRHAGISKDWYKNEGKGVSDSLDGRDLPDGVDDYQVLYATPTDHYRIFQNPDGFGWTVQRMGGRYGTGTKWEAIHSTPIPDEVGARFVAYEHAEGRTASRTAGRGAPRRSDDGTPTRRDRRNRSARKA